MKQRNYSVHVRWDKRYPKAGSDKCPIQLALNISGVQFRIGLGLYASKTEFDKAMSGKSGNAEVKELRSEINGYISKADELLKRIPNPTRESFQRFFRSETDLFKNNKTDVTFFFEDYIDSLRAEDRIKTAHIYEQSLLSLKGY